MKTTKTTQKSKSAPAKKPRVYKTSPKKSETRVKEASVHHSSRRTSESTPVETRPKTATTDRYTGYSFVKFIAIAIGLPLLGFLLLTFSEHQQAERGIASSLIGPIVFVLGFVFASILTIYITVRYERRNLSFWIITGLVVLTTLFMPLYIINENRRINEENDSSLWCDEEDEYCLDNGEYSQDYLDEWCAQEDNYCDLNL